MIDKSTCFLNHKLIDSVTLLFYVLKPHEPMLHRDLRQIKKETNNFNNTDNAREEYLFFSIKKAFQTLDTSSGQILIKIYSQNHWLVEEILF